MGNVGL
jgi:hypothetical protein